MAGVSWVVSVLLVDIVMCNESHKSAYRSVMEGDTTLHPLKPTETASKYSRPAGDLSKLENMMIKLGENVCQRFSGYGGCSSCGNCRGETQYCSNWLNDKPNKMPSVDEKLEQVFENLKAEIGKIKEEIKKCCQAPKEINLSDEFSRLLAPIMNSQRTIINNLQAESDKAKISANRNMGIWKKQMKEFSGMKAFFEQETAKIKVDMEHYYKKYSVCPKVKKVRNDISDGTWRITQSPLYGSRRIQKHEITQDDLEH